MNRHIEYVVENLDTFSIDELKVLLQRADAEINKRIYQEFPNNVEL